MGLNVGSVRPGTILLRLFGLCVRGVDTNVPTETRKILRLERGSKTVTCTLFYSTCSFPISLVSHRVRGCSRRRWTTRGSVRP